MPQLTRFYGLTPADIDAMTLREIDQYVTQLPDLERREARAIQEAVDGG